MWMLQPKKEIGPLTEKLKKAIEEGAAATEVLDQLTHLLAVYRYAKMDWSHTMKQLAAVAEPCGTDLVAPLRERIDAAETLIVEARVPRFEMVPKLKASEWEDARYEAAAFRVVLLHLIAESGEPLPAELDRYLLPQPIRLFEVAPRDGGTQHTFIANFLGVLTERALSVFQELPEDRAVAFAGAWRAFAPSKNLELNLKRFFKRRKEVLKAAPRSPSPLERCRELALRADAEETQRIYLLQKRADGSLNRIGGECPDHGPLMVLLDLGQLELGEGALAVLEDTSVVELDETQARAVEGGRGFSLAPVDVPTEVFGAFDDDGALGQLHTQLRRAEGRALGLPFPLQSKVPESAPDFVFEATGEVLRQNLGDAGKLFVYRDHAEVESA